MYKMIAEYRTGRSNRKTQMSFLYRFLLKTAVIAGIAVICFAFVLQIYRATGNTMSPFVRDGDLCVFYKLDKEYLNEVVLYHAEDEKLKIGRITGVGGQTIEFQEDGDIPLMVMSQQRRFHTRHMLLIAAKNRSRSRYQKMSFSF